MKILVFIPMYNCESYIGKTIQQFTPEVQKYFSKILLIDNRSTDNTVKKALLTAKEQLTIPWNILINAQNYSLGGSHKVAFEYCLQNNFDCCIVFHGDNQARINDIIPYLTAPLLSRYDQLLGSRFHHQAQLFNYGASRKWGNILLNTLLSLITLTWISDMGSGLNLYSANFLKKNYTQYCPDDLTFNIVLLLHACINKENTRYFPIQWHEEGSPSNARVLKQGLIILNYCYAYLFNRKKLYFQSNTTYTYTSYA